MELAAWNKLHFFVNRVICSNQRETRFCPSMVKHSAHIISWLFYSSVHTVFESVCHSGTTDEGNPRLLVTNIVYAFRPILSSFKHCLSICSCHRTLLTTVSSSRTPVDACFDRRILRCSLFDAPTVHLVIGVLLSLEPGSGTASRPLCAQPTCPLNGLNGHWRRFCLFETAARLWRFRLRPPGYKFSDIHTYIHTRKHAFSTGDILSHLCCCSCSCSWSRFRFCCSCYYLYISVYTTTI